MAFGEVVELGEWRSNSLAADSALGAALDVLDVCAEVCYRAECKAVALGAGRLVAHDVEDAVVFHHEVLGHEILVLDDVDHDVEQENKQKPKA
jgi:hypothetical protein